VILRLGDNREYMGIEKQASRNLEYSKFIWRVTFFILVQAYYCYNSAKPKTICDLDKDHHVIEVAVEERFFIDEECSLSPVSST